MRLYQKFGSSVKGNVGTRYAVGQDRKVTVTFGGGRLSDAALALQEIRGLPAQTFDARGLAF